MCIVTVSPHRRTMCSSVLFIVLGDRSKKLFYTCSLFQFNRHHHSKLDAFNSRPDFWSLIYLSFAIPDSQMLKIIIRWLGCIINNWFINSINLVFCRLIGFIESEHRRSGWTVDWLKSKIDRGGNWGTVCVPWSLSSLAVGLFINEN